MDAHPRYGLARHDRPHAQLQATVACIGFEVFVQLQLAKSPVIRRDCYVALLDRLYCKIALTIYHDWPPFGVCLSGRRYDLAGAMTMQAQHRSDRCLHLRGHELIGRYHHSVRGGHVHVLALICPSVHGVEYLHLGRAGPVAYCQQVV